MQRRSVWNASWNVRDRKILRRISQSHPLFKKVDSPGLLLKILSGLHGIVGASPKLFHRFRLQYRHLNVQIRRKTVTVEGIVGGTPFRNGVNPWRVRNNEKSFTIERKNAEVYHTFGHAHEVCV